MLLISCTLPKVHHLYSQCSLSPDIAVSLESEEDLIVRETEIQPLTVCAKLTNPVDFPFNIGFVLENAAGDGKSSACL